MKSSLELVTTKLFYTRGFALFFTTIPPKSKAVTVNLYKEKSFHDVDTRQRRRVLSFQVTRPLRQFPVCVVHSLSFNLRCSLSSGVLSIILDQPVRDHSDYIIKGKWNASEPNLPPN